MLGDAQHPEGPTASELRLGYVVLYVIRSMRCQHLRYHTFGMEHQMGGYLTRAPLGYSAERAPLGRGQILPPPHLVI